MPSLKATDGIEGESDYFLQDSTAAAEAGLIIGSYHKAHPDVSATKQADEYAAALAKLPADAAKLPPVLDIELDNGLSTKQLQDWTDTFLKRVEQKTGRTPMIYTYRWFWQSPMGNTEKFKQYPLWLAAYQPTPPADIPGGWDKLTFWQRSSTGKVPGIPTIVDQNTFNGSAAELQQIISGAPASAPVSSSSASQSATTSQRTTKSSTTTAATTEPAAAKEPSAEATTTTTADEAEQPASLALIKIVQQWMNGEIGNRKFSAQAHDEGVSSSDTQLMVALRDQMTLLGKNVDKQLQHMRETAAQNTQNTAPGSAPLVTISDIIALIATATR